MTATSTATNTTEVIEWWHCLVLTRCVHYGGLCSTWIGDSLWTGKPSRYITSHPGQLSLPSLWGGKSSAGLPSAIAIQQQTKKPSEGARCRSQLYPWTSLQLQQLSSGINRASLRIVTLAINMPGSIEVLQAASTVTSVGNGFGPGTSA